MTLRLTAFAAALALVFAGAALAGNAFGPEPKGEDEMTMEGQGRDESHGGLATAAAPEAAPPGLSVSEGGLRLELERSIYRRGRDQRIDFAVLDGSGEPVGDFEVEHEREMHLIVVRRDLEAFQHLHPKRDAEGNWSAVADLSRPGAYRVFADFATPEASLTLGSDVFVGGEFDPRPLPAPAATAAAGDGYEVTLEESGESVRFIVERGGERVEDIEPYLGADGHLVALRDGDLAFLHTHPSGDPGGPIDFGVEYPSPGRYRLYLQFKHRGEVRTAAFTQEVIDEPGH